jgi:hypothetical protein
MLGAWVDQTVHVATEPRAAQLEFDSWKGGIFYISFAFLGAGVAQSV